VIWGVSLRAYVDQRLGDLQAQMDRRIADDRHHQELQAVEDRRNLDIAAGRIDDRLEGMNQFRQQLTDQAGRFITRAEIELERRAVTERLAEMTRRLDRVEVERSTAHETRSAQARRAQVVFGMWLGAATLLLSVVVFAANYLSR
jgi:hypothetical protein